MYKLILLDLDGTVLDYDRSEKYALKKTLKSFGINSRHENYIKRYKKINLKIWEDYEKGLIGKLELRVERFRQLLKKELSNEEIKKASTRYLDNIGSKGFKISGAVKLCKYLNSKYRVVALTNGIRKVQVSRMEKSKLEKYFEGIVTPGDAGVQKPHPDIFKYTLEKYNHEDKKSVIIIGDSLTSDIKGGNNFGIDTCWVNLKKGKNPYDLNITHEIFSLDQLNGIL